LLQPTDARFTVPETFRFEDYVKYSFKVMTDEIFSVRICISPSWARYVGERVWHASQHIQKLIDGGIEISFRVAGLDEIRQWVLSLGPQACVVEPVELREAVRRDMREALGQYGMEPLEEIGEAGALETGKGVPQNRPIWHEGSRG